MTTKQIRQFASFGIRIGVVVAVLVAPLFYTPANVAFAAEPKNSNTAPNTTDSSNNDTSSVLSDPAKGNDCGGVKTAIIKCNADNSGDLNKNGIWALLLIVLNVMTAGVGVVAVGGIVYGAILYTMAEDKADQVKKATDIITNVVIGLVAFALMWAGLNFLIPGGVFAA